MKDLSKEKIFIGNSSSIKFFTTNNNKNGIKNILITNEKDIELINFLINKGIFNSNRKIVSDIKKNTYEIVIGEPLNQKIDNIEQEESIYSSELIEIYKKFSDKEYSNKYVNNIKNIGIEKKEIHIFENLKDFIKNIKNYSFPYVLKNINGKGGKGTFIIKDENDLNNSINIFLEKKNIGKKTEGIENSEKIIMEKFIPNKVDLNVNINFFENNEGKVEYDIIGITQQLTEGSLYRGNISISKKYFDSIYSKIKVIADQLKIDGYKGNIGIDLMLDIHGNLYFNEFNTRFNSSTIFAEYLNQHDFENAELILFESRTGKIDIKELKVFLIKEGIKGNVLPYEVNWEKGTIIFLIKCASTSRFLNKNITLQESSKEDKKNKNILLSKIRENGYFQVRFDFASDQSKASLKYYENENKEKIKFEDKPIFAFTGPRGAGKNYFSEMFLELYGEYIDFAPQISCREHREDDDINFIKTISKKEFDGLKDKMYVYNGKYGILKEDIENILEKGKIPICILGWKEILKLEKSGNTNLLIFNTTYPIEMNGEMSEDTINIIKNQRFSGRGWDEKIKNNNIESIKKYMNFFFNHPTFQKLLIKNYITTKDNENEFIKYFGNLIKNILECNN